MTDLVPPSDVTTGLLWLAGIVLTGGPLAIFVRWRGGNTDRFAKVNDAALKTIQETSTQLEKANDRINELGDEIEELKRNHRAEIQNQAGEIRELSYQVRTLQRKVHSYEDQYGPLTEEGMTT